MSAWCSAGVVVFTVLPPYHHHFTARLLHPLRNFPLIKRGILRKLLEAYKKRSVGWLFRLHTITRVSYV